MRLLRETVEGNLTSYVTTAPRPRVSFEFQSPPYFGLDLSKHADATLLSTGVTVPCQITRGQLFATEPSSIWLRPLHEIGQGALKASVSKVIVLITNFPDFVGESIIRTMQGGGEKREDQIKLEFSDWTLTIENTADIDERKAALDSYGGYGVTALGVFERRDTNQFVWDDIAPQIEAVRVFLSFLCGRWIGVMLPAGLSPTGEPVWFRWRVPALIDEGFTVFTWFDPHHATTMTDIVPGFMDKWTDPVWKDGFSHAIYWFVRANSAAAGADGSLILSQAALETLSWTYLVQNCGMSRSKFKDLKTSEAIRQLLTALRIPPDVPTAFGSLQSVANTCSPPDGVSAIVKVRNGLAHPEKQKQPVPVNEAWTLAQRFIELVLLNLCGFNGDHANRTISPRWLGQVERVPWA